MVLFSIWFETTTNFPSTCLLTLLQIELELYPGENKGWCSIRKSTAVSPLRLYQDQRQTLWQKSSASSVRHVTATCSSLAMAPMAMPSFTLLRSRWENDTLPATTSLALSTSRASLIYTTGLMRTWLLIISIHSYLVVSRAIKHVEGGLIDISNQTDECLLIEAEKHDRDNRGFTANIDMCNDPTTTGLIDYLAVAGHHGVSSLSILHSLLAVANA